ACARLERDLKRVRETLAPLVNLADFEKPWLAKLNPFGEAAFIDRPIDMKGDLSDPLWSKAGPLGNFGNGSSVPEDPTEVRLLYTDEALYVGFTCYESHMDKITAVRTERDSNVWQDDSVEVFLNPDSLLLPWWQFIVNVNGVQFDGVQQAGAEFDSSWNGDWQAATARTADRWTAEIRIPFSTLGLDGRQKGRIWMCNFARNDKANDRLERQGWAEYETSSYGAEPRGSLHDTRKFRPILFR
ncbi:MAG: carbohydrate binding family 9 domain-containing protein, partial [Armatimonadota bacterium]